jgi:hypothetical protein
MVLNKSVFNIWFCPNLDYLIWNNTSVSLIRNTVVADNTIQKTWLWAWVWLQRRIVMILQSEFGSLGCGLEY